jgi:hypothetical protein
MQVGSCLYLFDYVYKWIYNVHIVVLELRSHDAERNARFVVHTVQLVPDQSYRHNENHKVRVCEYKLMNISIADVNTMRERQCVTCIQSNWWSNIRDMHSEMVGIVGRLPCLILVAIACTRAD